MLSTEPQLQEVLSTYAEAKNAHDIEAALACCTDDCAYESTGIPGRIEGKEALRSFYGALFELMPDYRGDFDGTVITGDTALAWGRFGGTVAATGRKVSVPVVFVCHFRDGLLCSDVGHFDSRDLYAQAGLTHPLDAAAADFVARFSQAWARPDLETFAPLAHPEGRFFYTGMEDWRDADGLMEYLSAAIATIDGLKLEVTRWVPDGDAVFIEWTGSGSVGGNPVSWAGADRFVLRDGKAIEGRAYFDASALTAAATAAAAAAG